MQKNVDDVDDDAADNNSDVIDDVNGHVTNDAVTTQV